MPVYLDCNATTPIEPEVAEVVRHYLEIDFGNAGSRTHEFGQRAAEAVSLARRQVASVANASPEEVIFTSGATEGLNIAILGLAHHGEMTGRKHIVSTMIEHKAVLEPLEELRKRGFEVELIRPAPEGYVNPDDVAAVLRPDTLLVAVMQVNNETGVIQPIKEIADRLAEHEAYFLVDASQGFGKELEAPRNKRIDMIAVSGHKLFAPMGVGALITRMRDDYTRAPLKPLMYGGGQERGLRPGTLAVPLIAGLGKAAEIAIRDHGIRRARCLEIRQHFLDALGEMPHQIVGDVQRVIPHTVMAGIAGINSEAAMLALKGVAAVSNGSACTSASYEPSHVLLAMNIDPEGTRSAIRISWCHLSEDVDWSGLLKPLKSLSMVHAEG